MSDIDEIKRQNALMKKALYMMGKFIRDNPPQTLDSYFQDPTLLSILVGGTDRDPKGKEYVYYFINKASAENWFFKNIMI